MANCPRAAGLAILMEVCRAADHAKELAAQINADGLTVVVKGQLRAHPPLRDELQTYAFNTQKSQRLGLNVEVVVKPMPPAHTKLAKRMSTKKRKPSRGGGPPMLTPEVIGAFKHVLALYYDDPEGEEYLHARIELHCDLLRRDPSQECIIATVGHDGPPPPWMNAAQAEDWRQAQAIRIALEAACEAADA